MGLFERIARLIDKRFDEKLDSSGVRSGENPASRVRRLISEMRKHLNEARSTLGLAVRDERRLVREIRRVNKEIERWKANARQALEVGREDLAREALKRKLGAGNFLDELEAEHEKLCRNVQVMKRYVVDLERKLKEAQARERLLLQKQRRIRQAEFLKSRFPEHKQHLVRAALEELEDDTDRLAHSTLLLEEDPLERRFRELENRDELVDDELKDLKDELGGDDASEGDDVGSDS